MMQAERRKEFAEQGAINKANGYRFCRVDVNGKSWILPYMTIVKGKFNSRVLKLFNHVTYVYAIYSDNWIIWPTI